MSFLATATVGDTGRVLAVVLREESAPGVLTPVDLSGVSIIAKFDPTDGGVTLTVPGLSGTAGGVVSVSLDTITVVAKRFNVEWLVVGGATFPSAVGDRPRLVVRERA